MGAIKLAKAEMCSSQSWQKSQNVNNDQQSAENTEYRWWLRGNTKTCLGLPKFPSFGNFVGFPMNRMLGTGSVGGEGVPFFAGLSELSGFSQVGNAVGIVFSGGILVFPLLLTPRPGSAEAQPSAHCVRVSFYKPEFSSLPVGFFFFFWSVCVCVLIALT